MIVSVHTRSHALITQALRVQKFDVLRVYAAAYDANCTAHHLVRLISVADVGAFQQALLTSAVDNIELAKAKAKANSKVYVIGGIESSKEVAQPKKRAKLRVVQAQPKQRAKLRVLK